MGPLWFEVPERDCAMRALNMSNSAVSKDWMDVRYHLSSVLPLPQRTRCKYLQPAQGLPLVSLNRHQKTHDRDRDLRKSGITQDLHEERIPTVSNNSCAQQVHAQTHTTYNQHRQRVFHSLDVDETFQGLQEDRKCKRKKEYAIEKRAYQFGTVQGVGEA